MKIQIFMSFFLATVVTRVFSADKCHYESMEKCGDHVKEFRKANGQRFPTTEEKVKEFCDHLQEGYDCAEDYSNKCMTPMQLQIMGYLTEGSQQVYDELCTSKSDLQTKYIKHAPCMNEAYESEESKSYASYFEAGMENLMDKPPTERLPLACCGYQWLKEKTDKMGEEKCGEEAVETFQKVVDMAVSSLPSVLCQGFEPEGAQCVSILPPLGSKPKGNLRSSSVAQKFSQLYMQE